MGCNNRSPASSLVVKASNWRRTLQSALAEERAIAIPDEFDRVFRTHYGLVFRTAYRITGNAADAEDVSQVVFLRLFRREESAQFLDNRVLQNEESYLRRAAINAAFASGDSDGDTSVRSPRSASSSISEAIACGSASACCRTWRTTSSWSAA